MLEKLNDEQLKKLLYHAVGMNDVLLKAYLPDTGLEEEKAADESFDIFTGEFDVEDYLLPEPVHHKGVSFSEIAGQSFADEYYDPNRRRREQDFSRLCGRWMAGKNRCGVEISRAGEHFVLTYLKRNGRSSGERYILLWIDGDILYYGGYDRLISIALNSQSDTLMISPGVDYTRQREDIK